MLSDEAILSDSETAVEKSAGKVAVIGSNAHDEALVAADVFIPVRTFISLLVAHSVKSHAASWFLEFEGIMSPQHQATVL